MGWNQLNCVSIVSMLTGVRVYEWPKCSNPPIRRSGCLLIDDCNCLENASTIDPLKYTTSRLFMENR